METLTFSNRSLLPRRLFVFAAAAYISGIAACYLFAPSAAFLGFVFATAMIAAALFFFSGRKRAAFAAFLGVLVLAGALQAHAAFLRTDGLENQMSNGAGYVQGFEGRVLSFEQKDAESFALTLLAEKRKVLVRYYGKEETLPPRVDLVGALVRVSGKLSYPDTARNPRCFDYRLFLLSKNIRVIVTADSPPLLCTAANTDTAVGTAADADVGANMGAKVRANAISGSEALWKTYNLIYRAKRIFTEQVQRVLGSEPAAIFIGMMFGETELMDDDTYDLFKRTGAAHILSVSGLHVGMVYAFVSAVLGQRRGKRFYAAVLLLLLLYAALSNFSPTVMRAVSMIAVHIGAKILNRRYDMLTGVFLSAVLCLAVNPLALFGAGFLLSYTAAAILAFALPFTARYTGFRNRLTGRSVRRDQLPEIYRVRGLRLLAADALALLLPMIVIQALLLPITAFFFNLVPLTALPANIPVLALSSLIVPLGIIVLLLSCLAAFLAFLAFSGFAPPPAAESVFAPLADLCSDAAGALTQSAGLLIDVMTHCTQAAAAIPGGSPAVCSPPLPLVILFYVLVFFGMSDAFALLGSSKNRWPILLSLVLVCFLLFASPVARTSDAPYTFVDVGQGDCLHIRTADGHNWLMDGGGKFDYDVGSGILLPYLQKNGVTHLDGVFVSHLHMDHFKGLCELSRVMPVGRVYVYEGHSANPEAVTEAYLDDNNNNKPGFGSADSNNNIDKEGSQDPRAIDDQARDKILNGFTAEDLVWLKAGDIVSLGGGATAEVLFPEARTAEEYETAARFEEDENKTSLLIRFSNGGLTALMTGDVGFAAEKAVLAQTEDGNPAQTEDAAGSQREQNLTADILKIGHHGSKTSTSEDFLSAVDPFAAVIQVGKNNYGHPTPEVLDRLADAALPVFRNDQSGAILAKPLRGSIFTEPAAGGLRILTAKRDFVSPLLRKPYE